VAVACDLVFPERHGWFADYYAELQEWSEVPAAFRNWTEREDKAGALRVWSPGIVHGLLQTEAYAAALLRTYPGVTDDAVAVRPDARMRRQRRLFSRDVLTWFIIDELSLYQLVGSPEIMAGQMRRLAEVAAMPVVTLQVLPPVAHPATGSEIIVADDSAYAEHAAGGFVYSGKQLPRWKGSSIPSGQSVTRRRNRWRYWRGWQRHGGLAEKLLQRGQRRKLCRDG
jgi:hypothetical protein